MPTLDRPQLRRFLEFSRDPSDPRFVILWDKARLSPAQFRLSVPLLAYLNWFNGQHTLAEVQSITQGPAGGQTLPLELLQDLAEKLDGALMLDGPRFRERCREQLAGPVREPSCIGCYEAEPAALRRQLTDLFTGPGGPGLPRTQQPDGRLRAALIPHIDYQRGGKTYAWGFKEVFERTDASLFVIIGTAHQSTHRYTLTRQDFKSPLGIARTDQDFIDRIVTHYGDGLFDDEVAHIPEHSIELEVVLLQYLYEGRRDIRIVPLLVGNFTDCVVTGSLPRFRPDIGRMIEALGKAEAETPESVCYIISGDLAHIGREFGDPQLLDEPFLDLSRRQDQQLCLAAEDMDVERYFRIIADEADSRRICGLPPTYTLLEAARPRRGRLLHYDQFVDPRRVLSVSFASVAFYR
jgi:AmmeMemoRadiSam system protein B